MIKNLKPKYVVPQVAILFILFIFVHINIAHAGGLVKPMNNLGLVGWWTLDEGTGTTAHDFSGQQNDGQITGTPVWTTGKRSKALTTSDSPGSYVNVGDKPSLRLSSAGTVSAWIKSTNFNCDGGSYCGVIDKFNGTTDRNGYSLTITAGFPELFVADSSGFQEVGSPTQLSLNTWNHVVASWNGSRVRIYVNGIMTQDTPQTQSVVDGGLSFALGNNIAFGGRFNGIIDDARVYSRELSPNEVLNLYGTGKVTLKPTANKGLIGYWPFDEGTSTISYDLSGNNNTMSNVNMESTDWFPGKRGKSLDFDGVNEYGLVNNLTVPTEGTFSAWVTSDFDESTCCSSFPMLFVSSDPRTSVWYNGTSDAYSLSTNGSLTNRATYSVSGDLVGWFHLAVTWSASGSQFYKDGVPVGTAGTGDNSGASGSTFYLGTRPALDRWWDGKMDDVHLYNRVLSANEIMSLYKTGEQVVGRTQSDRLSNGLVGYWSFNGQDISWPSNLVYNRSGLANNGTTVNMNKNSSVVPGKSGQALLFNGINNNVTVIGNSSVSNLVQKSACAWIKPNANGDILTKSDNVNATGSGWNFFLAGNILRYYQGHCGGADMDGYGPTIPLNTWSHVCFSHDDSSNSNPVMFYLNGVESGSGGTGANVVCDDSSYVQRMQRMIILSMVQ
jgi:hypothetical protein